MWFTFVVSLIQMTPLHIVAARGDHISIVKYLIRKGADINIKDHKGVNMHVCVCINGQKQDTQCSLGRLTL